MKKNDLNLFGISIENLEMLAKLQSQDKKSPEIEEAIKAINIASRVVNTIMSGSQIDPVFFKSLIDDAKRKVEALDGASTQKKVLKKKKKFKKIIG